VRLLLSKYTMCSPPTSGYGCGTYSGSTKISAPVQRDSHSRKSPSQSAGFTVTMMRELNICWKYAILTSVRVAVFTCDFGDIAR
jgi:hypothetical protein